VIIWGRAEDKIPIQTERRRVMKISQAVDYYMLNGHKN
jgi:hypothetical protein